MAESIDECSEDEREPKVDFEGTKSGDLSEDKKNDMVNNAKIRLYYLCKMFVLGILTFETCFRV